MGVEFQLLQSQGESAVPERALTPHTLYTLHNNNNNNNNKPIKRLQVKMASKIRQNFHEDSEALINKQINMEFYASYVYLSMSSWFNRDDQALHGFASFFRKASDEERDHGMKLMEYQTSRGGRCKFQDVAKPTTMEWGTPLQAMEAALELETRVKPTSATSWRATTSTSRWTGSRRSGT